MERMCQMTLITKQEEAVVEEKKATPILWFMGAAVGIPFLVGLVVLVMLGLEASNVADFFGFDSSFLTETDRFFVGLMTGAVVTGAWSMSSDLFRAAEGKGTVQERLLESIVFGLVIIFFSATMMLGVMYVMTAVF